jgi:gliding motility-associated-like protein
MNLLLRSLFFSILFCLVLLSGYAQQDTDFWFVAPEVAESHGDAPIRFQFSAFEEEAVVRVSMPANPAFSPRTVTVPPNTVRVLDVTGNKSVVENWPPNQVLNKGLLITASASINAFYEVLSSNNPDMFPLKGNNALGKQFFVPTQFHYPNVHGNNSIDIVATRDNTSITITPTQAIVGHAAGQAFTIVLNRGETYSAAAINTSGVGHLRGTKIVSDKPIAVTSSDDSIRIGAGYDLTGDQLVPVELLGTEYIAMRGTFDGERVYVTAVEDGTTISVSGGTPANITINEGQTVDFRFSSSGMFLSANKRIYVLHLTGEDVEAGSALLPPINCTGAQQVGFIKGEGTNYLYLLTQSGNEGNFELNGNSGVITAGNFSVIPGSGGAWVAARINATNSLNFNTTNMVRNTSGLFHLGIMYYTGRGSSYGYFSQYNSLYFGGEVTICEGDTTILDAGPDRDSYRWSDGSQGQTLAVTEPGKYWVTITYETCTLTDTAQVFVIKAPVDLGPDTTMCIGQDLTLDATHPYGSYLWSDGSTDSTLQVRESGIYAIERRVDGCATQDDIQVDFIGPPRVELGDDTTLCRGEMLSLDLYTPDMTYRWQDGSTDSIYAIESPGQYWVDVNLDGCITRDSIYNFSIFEDLTLGGDTALCDNEFLSYDLSFPNTNYRWNDGSTSPVRRIDTEGEYSVEIWDVCQTVFDTIRVRYQDCSCGVYVPTAFSPNADGINDEFGATYQCLIDSYNLRIYNRWGVEVYDSDNPDLRWDGSYQGKPAQEGVYVWVLTYYASRNRRPIAIQESGSVTVLR